MSFVKQMQKTEILQLSRFAVFKREKDYILLLQPVTGFSVPIRKTSILQIILRFTKPTALRNFFENIDSEKRSAIEQLISVLRKKDVLVQASESSSPNEDSSLMWQLHDLIFHTQSRQGTNVNELGATYRFGKGKNSETHIRKEGWRGEEIQLPKFETVSDAQNKDSGFQEILRKRKTSYKTSSLNLTELSRLLQFSLHVKNRNFVDSDEKFLEKFYPSGGALHSIETYLAIYNFEDLADGFYYYDCVEHKLVRISVKKNFLESILKSAQISMGMNEIPAAVFLFSSRFERVLFKYESLGYRLILLELGGIFQTLYLVSAALNLSVCALGKGNSSEFSESLNLDYFRETSIGEFALNGRL